MDSTHGTKLSCQITKMDFEVIEGPLMEFIRSNEFNKYLVAKSSRSFVTDIRGQHFYNIIIIIILGVRQDGPESPPLFNLYIFVMRLFLEKGRNENIDFFNHCYRINVKSFRDERALMKPKKLFGKSFLEWRGYADDLVLFLQS